MASGLYKPIKVLKRKIELRPTELDMERIDYPPYEKALSEAESGTVKVSGTFKGDPEQSVARFFLDSPVDEVVNYRFIADLVDYADFDVYRNARKTGKVIMFKEAGSDFSVQFIALAMPMKK